AAAELRGPGVEHQRGAAELADGDVEADARAGRVLLEHHGQHAAVERLVRIRPTLRPVAPDRLAIERVADHRGDRVAAGVGQVEEMPRRHHAVSAGLKSAAPAESLSKNSSISASPMTSGGSTRTVLSPAATVSSLWLSRRCCMKARGSALSLRPSISPLPRTSSNSSG